MVDSGLHFRAEISRLVDGLNFGFPQVYCETGNAPLLSSIEPRQVLLYSYGTPAPAKKILRGFGFRAFITSTHFRLLHEMFSAHKHSPRLMDARN